MLRNPFASGKTHAYSRWGSVTAIRTKTHRLIRSGGGANDLYDLSTHRYELADISSSEPALTTSLASQLNQQSTRSGTSYETWSDNNALLLDPASDADLDGMSNLMEYLTGTDPLVSGSRAQPSLVFENLGRGTEPVFSFQISSSADDFSLTPSTSTNLQDWSPTSLEFLDTNSSPNEDNLVLRFRLSEIDGNRRFFRTEAGIE
jgi:hypothetical protein